MSVLIQINGDTAAEALKELATLAGPLGGGQAAPATAEAPKSSRSNRGATKPAADPKPEQAEPPVQNEPDPEAPAEQEPADEVPGDGDAPIPTVVDLRERASDVGKTPEGRKAVKALLEEFGSKSISDVPENKRAAFMAKLENLA